MGSSLILLIAISIALVSSNASKIDPREVKCLVCKATVQEMEDAISKVDPNKIVEISGFRIDDQGNTISKTAKYSTSEVYLTELMETICSTMDDYLKAIKKKTGKLEILKTTMDSKFSSMMSEVDFVQDGDLNKSLPHYCLEILDDHEEVFLKAFMSDTLESDLDIRICSQMTNYCSDAPVQEDYELEGDEFKDEL